MDEVTINCKKGRKSYLNVKENSKQKDRKLHKIVHCLEKIQYGQTEGQMNKQLAEKRWKNHNSTFSSF